MSLKEASVERRATTSGSASGNILARNFVAAVGHQVQVAATQVLGCAQKNGFKAA
ncbi:MAG: hypothetical protein ACLTTP_02970 [Alistipes ihumii]